ncbi:TonB-dependent receptor [Janthinobacterium sp. 17J80-10]|uniref:TonB-dependent receptor plug domain-containing protein n=1 Tax=Janthinobacterium sp. 17J80-10 TaxID=2497863 RepID=UPI00100562F3|nr:TonB-dependent receptor [Janthinobacterium sp. 17J80-10]QAU34519.1 TonB-dependent receptor [Janthinobacterium sp. 17J80-10]
MDKKSIAELDLEELGNIRVSSVSKRPESLANAPGSIFVISAADIRRSSASTLPEVLRLAPNLQVSRVDARNYAITARGFNSPFENKLLVLIDGRTVYSPLFSGVFWDAQDVVLEDVERIEVISGPGATLWGSNAVNGVINVITRSSADTQGALVAAVGSSSERNGAFRFGGALENGGHYRVYGKYAGNDDTRLASNAPDSTGWRRRQAGFRTDWDSGAQTFTFQGDAYTGSLHQAGTRDIETTGANLLGRTNARLADGSSLSVQAYWDFTERNQPNAFNEHLNTLDFQFQHSLNMASAHDVIWGAGYRKGFDRIKNDVFFAFLPASLNMHWGNIFIQDEIRLNDDLRLTAGAKIEDNNYTGAEFLPSLRLAWNPAKNNLLWASASRAVRTPSRIDRDFHSPSNPPIAGGVPQYVFAGGPNFASEIANVVELGYRVQPTKTTSYSATAFYTQFNRLRTLEPNPSGPGFTFGNMAEGTARGIEMWGNWQATSRWRLSAGFVAQHTDTALKPGSLDISGATGLATRDPSNFWTLRSQFDFARGQEIDITICHTGKLERPLVPAYTAVDLRYGWRVRPDLELSVIGQNLFDPRHPEWGAAPGRSEYERSVFIKAVWRR